MRFLPLRQRPGRDHATRHAAMDEALEVAERAWKLEQDTEPSPVPPPTTTAR